VNSIRVMHVKDNSIGSSLQLIQARCLVITSSERLTSRPFVWWHFFHMVFRLVAFRPETIKLLKRSNCLKRQRTRGYAGKVKFSSVISAGQE